MHWKEFRKKVIENYEKEKRKGRIDKDIIPLLDLINSFGFFATLSSCSGRIYLIDIPKFGEKEKCKILAKWHDLACAKYILENLKKGKEQTWFLMQPPILHVSCENLEHARKLLKIAVNSGFSSSGIISLKRNIVRIHSNERIELLIGINGKALLDEKYIKIITEIANEKLLHAKKRIERFSKLLVEEFPC